MTIHQRQPVLGMGQPLAAAKAVLIMLHGRGARAEDILSLVPELDQPDFAYLAPQAAGNTWYPYRFLEPREKNEPHLTSALATISGLVDHVLGQGFTREHICLLGFSQGACLAVEWAARHPQRYGGVFVLSGGLIGDVLTPIPGSLDGTPAFFGCSDVDFHIPKERVTESAEMLRTMNAEVTVRLYPGMGHTINEDEIAAVHGIMEKVAGKKSE
jgi:predicted esterase